VQFVTIAANYCSALHFPAVVCARDTRPYKLIPRTEPTNSFESWRDSQETCEILLLVHAATTMRIEQYHILADYQHKILPQTHTYKYATHTNDAQIKCSRKPSLAPSRARGEVHPRRANKGHQKDSPCARPATHRASNRYLQTATGTEAEGRIWLDSSQRRVYDISSLLHTQYT